MSRNDLSLKTGPVPAELPAPDAIALAHSARLQTLIREEIAAQGGQISFARYMELALYAPGLGYYSAGAHKFGAQGDFVTAPEISPLFARCVARQCRQVLEYLDGGDILEIGAGSGKMACDVLSELAALNCLPGHYYILELSADLRERQAALLKTHLPHLMERITWLDALPRAGWRGVVLANELLDAMPVHRFLLTEAGARELYVSWRDGHFVWREDLLSHPALTERITALGEDAALSAGFTSEINLAADAWVRSIAAVLDAGLLLIIDYGFPRREYYHPQRATGTLMCHYRHRAHADPLILTGLQDITSHVDFTAIATAACLAGLSVSGYTTQAHFLLSSGLDDMITDVPASLTRQHLETLQQVKKLTLPSEMGELFKVIALTRGIDAPLLGFSLRDMRGRL